MNVKDLISAARWAGWDDAIIDRVERLNQNYKAGDKIRGIVHAKTAWHMRMTRDVVGKGEFIKQHGRTAWDRIPRSYKNRSGKRYYVVREAVEDNVWMRP